MVQQLPPNVGVIEDREVRQALIRAWEELSRAATRLDTCEARLTTTDAKVASLETEILELRQVRDLTQRP